MSFLAEDHLKMQRLSNASESSSTSSCTTISELDESHMSTESHMSSQNIRVVARIRPISSREEREDSKQVLVPSNETDSIRVDQNKTFFFDKVFQPEASQSEVYEQTAGDMIQNHLFKGFNVTVLAYGQTGSGKTHTIFGANGNRFTSTLNEIEDGIIPRAVHELFDLVKRTPDGQERMKVDMSFLEIYNEEAKDLLCADPDLATDLTIRESPNGVVVRGLSRHNVVSPNVVAALMVSAAEKRSVASTLMNEVSSR